MGKVAAGLCEACGQAQVMPGRRRCPACLERLAAKMKEREELRLAAGMCPRCGRNAPAQGRRLCGPCLLRVNRYARNFHARRRAARLCTRCGAPLPADDLHARCDECRRRDKIAEERRRGQCAGQAGLQGGLK